MQARVILAASSVSPPGPGGGGGRGTAGGGRGGAGGGVGGPRLDPRRHRPPHPQADRAGGQGGAVLRPGGRGRRVQAAA